MQHSEPEIERDQGALISRRTALGGILAAAVAPLAIAQVRAHSPIAQTFSAAVELPAGDAEPLPRFDHASAPLNGQALLSGGWRHTGLPSYTPPLASVQLFNSVDNTWTNLAPMRTARAQHAAVALADGRVMVMGGMAATPLSTAEIYDPVADAWSEVSPMPESRYGHSAIASGGQVIVNGGFHRGPLVAALIYDVATDSWQKYQ